MMKNMQLQDYAACSSIIDVLLRYGNAGNKIVKGVAQNCAVQDTNPRTTCYLLHKEKAFCSIFFTI